MVSRLVQQKASTLCILMYPGFFQPASGAVMPTLVKPDQLQAANALFQGSSQLLGFVGPMLGGAAIAAFGTASLGQGAAGSLGIGVAFGIAGALALTGFLEKLLFGVRPNDAATLVCASLLLISVAGAASYLPARRAADRRHDRR